MCSQISGPIALPRTRLALGRVAIFSGVEICPCYVGIILITLQHNTFSEIEDIAVVSEILQYNIFLKFAVKYFSWNCCVGVLDELFIQNTNTTISMI